MHFRTSSSIEPVAMISSSLLSMAIVYCMSSSKSRSWVVRNFFILRRLMVSNLVMCSSLN